MENTKRAPNFSPAEEELLVSLVAKYRNILECKKTDAVTTQIKLKGWIKVSEEFNINSGTFREASILKRKYENLKKRSKKKFADEKCYSSGTGGGPPKVVTITEVDHALKNILGTQIMGMTSEYDDDAIESQTPVADEVQEYITNNETFEIVQQAELEMPSTSTNCVAESPISWGTYTPAQLKCPRSKNLVPRAPEQQFGTKVKSANVWDNVGKAKLELVALQKKYLEDKSKREQEEHQLRMEQLREEHELKIRLLEAQINSLN